MLPGVAYIMATTILYFARAVCVSSVRNLSKVDQSVRFPPI
jgi:hypothetical protein